MYPQSVRDSQAGHICYPQARQKGCGTSSSLQTQHHIIHRHSRCIYSGTPDGELGYENIDPRAKYVRSQTVLAAGRQRSRIWRLAPLSDVRAQYPVALQGTLFVRTWRSDCREVSCLPMRHGAFAGSYHEYPPDFEITSKTIHTIS